MAQPSFVIDQNIRHFLHLWSHGYQPSLTFNTDQFGAILISSSIIYFPPYGPPQQPQKHYAQHRSGKKSRIRRQKLRASVLTNPNTSQENLKDKVAIEEHYDMDAEASFLELTANESLSTNYEKKNYDFNSETYAASIDELEFGDGVRDVLNDYSVMPNVESSNTSLDSESPQLTTSEIDLHSQTEELSVQDKPLSELTSSECTQLMDEIRTILGIPPKLS